MLKEILCNGDNDDDDDDNNNNNNLHVAAVVTTLWAGRLRKSVATPDRDKRFLSPKELPGHHWGLPSSVYIGICGVFPRGRLALAWECRLRPAATSCRIYG
jgi:hypothetical protein